MNFSIYIKFIVFLSFVFPSLAKIQAYWFKNTVDFKKSLELPIHVEIQKVSPPAQILYQRSQNLLEREDNELPSAYLKNTPEDLLSFVKRVGLPNTRQSFLKKLEKKYGNFEGDLLKVEIDKELAPFIFFEHLSKLHEVEHYKVFIKGKSLRSDVELLEKLFWELRYFLSKNEMHSLLKQLRHKKYVDIDKYALPAFAKKAVNQYTRFRGLNCFHAALAFQDLSIPSNQRFHPNRLKNYHWRMINHDELWRALQYGFYEINPKDMRLKYGDILVFFDIPPYYTTNRPAKYSWIKHATVYLFNGMTFSKGSKSANTTYTVQPLEEEIRKWRQNTKKFGMKIFRKSQIHVKRLPYLELHNWLF